MDPSSVIRIFYLYVDGYPVFYLFVLVISEEMYIVEITSFHSPNFVIIGLLSSIFVMLRMKVIMTLIYLYRYILEKSAMSGLTQWALV